MILHFIARSDLSGGSGFPNRGWLLLSRDRRRVRSVNRLLALSDLLLRCLALDWYDGTSTMVLVICDLHFYLFYLRSVIVLVLGSWFVIRCW